MKKSFYIYGILFVCLAVITGCGIISNIGSGISGGTFVSPASSTTPVFKPATAGTAAVRGSVATRSAWGSGNELYSVFFSLREFVSPRDEGVVDRSNLYKLLTDVDTVFSGLSGMASSITEEEITPPFTGLPKVTCNKMYNNESNDSAVAMKETDSEIKAIISWIWGESSMPLKKEYGLSSIQYDKTTNAITVEMTYSVDYDTTSSATEYNLRCNVSGNAAENSFQFRYIIGNTKIVAKGISRGAGNYMLFKYAQGSGSTKYIVVPGDADESFFVAQNTSPTQIYTNEADLPSTVSAYKDWVVSTPFLTTSDLVTDISVLNSGNARQGTIFIDH